MTQQISTQNHCQIIMAYDLHYRLNEGEGENEKNIRVQPGIEHNFKPSQHFRPRSCDHCGKLLKGFINQVLHHFDF